LTLPATEYVPFATLEKALAFAKAGGVVAGYGIKPSNTPTRGKTAADVSRIVDELFAQPTALFLEGEPNGAQLRAALARPYPPSPEATEDGSGASRPLAVRDLDFVGLSAADGRMLALDQYERNGDRIFFIANQDCQRRRDLTVRAAWPAWEAELWNPMQGTMERPTVADGMIRLALAPSEAVFLIWPKVPQRGLLAHVADPAASGKSCSLVLKRTVTRMVAGETLAELAGMLEGSKWIWHPAYSQAQGEVTFRARVEVAAAVQAKIAFSCDNAAVVRVNGKEVARQEAGVPPDYPGWRMPTGATFALKAGENEIEVLADNVLPGYAGFVATITWSGGELRTAASAWEVSHADEAAVRPQEVAAYGASPWGRLNPSGQITQSPFQESVATDITFTLPTLKAGSRVYFVCEDVEGEKSAALTVNGRFAGGFIGAPYRVDITQAVTAGANTLQVKPFRVVTPRIIVVEAPSRATVMALATASARKR
ncbi:MAG: hypothetical protein J6334_03350, partial [Kiritimatiellae bacterium]|nr:hypothetical protein [Kiritimatiellia bacterium]